jgi:hypothetical protein
MAKTRALKDAATDPLAKKEGVASKKEEGSHSIGHYVLTISIGLIAGVVGGLLSSRILKVL